MKKVMDGTKVGSQKKIEAVLAQEVSKSQKMKDLFDLGLEVKEIGELMGVRYNFAYNVVSNYVNMNGIPVETTKKAGKRDKIVELYLAGKSNKEISIELQTNYNYVFNVLKAYKKAQEIKAAEGK